MNEPSKQPDTKPTGEPRLTSVSADLLEPPSRLAQLTIRAIAATVALAIAWSYVTPVVEVAAGTGKVIPDRHVQTIQSVEGGYVVGIYAANGDSVEKGELLVRLDPEPSGKSKEEIEQQIVGLRANAVRLRALLDGARPDFPADMLRRNQKFVAVAMSQYDADRTELASSLQAIESQIEQKKSELAEARAQLKTTGTALRLAKEEFFSLRKLQSAQAASRAEVMAAEGRVNELQGTIDRLKLLVPRLEEATTELTSRRLERESAFRSKAAGELNDSETRIAALTASLAGQQNRQDRTEIRAPISGVLKTVLPTNIGQVIKPYEAVAEIVPASETVLVQAKIRPEDIGFIEKGMPAVIKLSAYDYSVFGALHGTLERIAADSTTDERGATYYMVDVRADKSFIERRGERWPVKSGMVANVEIVTGNKTVFQYLTKPIHRMATMALRER